MVALDEARLDELYQKVLQIELDMALEHERLGRLVRDVRLWLTKESQEIRALRESTRTELMECASKIFEWLKDLVGSSKGKKILSTVGEVVIFRGHYHNYKPSEEEVHEAWLTYDCNGLLRYREFWKGIGIKDKIVEQNKAGQEGAPQIEKKGTPRAVPLVSWADMQLEHHLINILLRLRAGWIS